MNHMTHPDTFKLLAAIRDHDERGGNTTGPDGKVAGVDAFTVLGAAGARAQVMAEGFGSLRKTLNPQQRQELERLLAAMWQDGFIVGAHYEAQHHTI
jgi:hypothetical protein